MKCSECEACSKTKITKYPAGNGQPSVEITYKCCVTKEPFEITDVEQECRLVRSVGCEYCSDDYDQKITCYNVRNHSSGDTYIKQIDVNFCPNCGRNLVNE
jgi:hypothetical protein